MRIFLPLIIGLTLLLSACLGESPSENEPGWEFVGNPNGQILDESDATSSSDVSEALNGQEPSLPSSMHSELVWG